MGIIGMIVKYISGYLLFRSNKHVKMITIHLTVVLELAGYK